MHVLALLPKDTEEGSGPVDRRPGRLRTLSCCNTDRKILSGAVTCPLGQVAQKYCLPRQRGGIKGRQMIDNIIELDTFMRLACFYSCIRPALLSFDLQAAFPSIIWFYIFAVLSAMGMPSAAIAFIKALYADARHIIRFKGRTVDAFTIENGILQGCPMSGALFAIALDPFMRRLLLRIHRPMQLYGDMIAAFLDDIGMVVGEISKYYRVYCWNSNYWSEPQEYI